MPWSLALFSSLSSLLFRSFSSSSYLSRAVICPQRIPASQPVPERGGKGTQQKPSPIPGVQYPMHSII